MNGIPISDWSRLNGVQQVLLRETILSAYVDPADFDMFLARRLNKPPLANFAAGSTFEQRIFSLIRKAQAQGWTNSLIEGLQADVPDNPLVRNFPDAVRMLAAEPARTATAVQPPSLEKIARGGGFEDIRRFAQKLAQIGEAVCRIETPAGTPNGTGILISPEFVITNYHVLERQIRSGANKPEITCRFDYARDAAGLAEGTPVTLADNDGWLIASSPYDPDVDTRGLGVAAADCLDFAIVRLSHSMPAERIPLPPRSDAIEIAKDMPVLVVQHPKGTPMALAMGASLGLNENRSRLRYDTDTLPGSSGSPVFNQHLDLIALHHAGDTDAVTRATYNQGIPFAKIASALTLMQEALQAKGISKFWR
jgi:hypothetical protein